MESNGMKSTVNFCVVSVVSALLLTSTIAIAEIGGITSRKVASCPLNSGGPSLLGTNWRVSSTYGNKISEEVDMKMTVNLDTMAGDTGCNKYAAKFKQVGFTGFTITHLNRTRNPCMRVDNDKGKPSVDLSRIEGAYLRIIRRMGSVQRLDDGKLVFYDRNGKKGLEMTLVK